MNTTSSNLVQFQDLLYIVLFSRHPGYIQQLVYLNEGVSIQDRVAPIQNLALSVTATNWFI